LVTFNGKYLVDGSKNVQGDATKTAATNQSLSENVTGATKLTHLQNRNNESLEIASTDYVTASYVKDGKTFTTSYQVGNSTLEDVFYNLNKLDNNKAVFSSANLNDKANAAVSSSVSVASDTYKKMYNAIQDSGFTSSETQVLYNQISDAISNNSFAGADSVNSSTVVNSLTAVSAAEKVLTDAIEGGFSGVTLAASATGVAGTVATAKFNIAYYEADGSSSTKTYEFSTNDTNGMTLNKIDNDTYQKMVNDIAESTKNYLNAAVDGKISASSDSVVNQALSATMVTGASAGDIGNSNVGVTSSVTLGSIGGSVVSNATVTATVANGFANSVYASKLAGAVHSGADIGVGKSGDMQQTADVTKGLTVTARTAGVGGQIGGVTISISDSQGNVKKSANAALDGFSESLRGENKSADNALNFQVGASANQAIAVGLTDMRSEALGLKGSDGTKLSVATQDKANAAVKVLDNALQKAIDQQTTIGSIEARLEYTSSNLTTSSENVQAAESTIRDADMAKEMTTYTKNNVLLQAAQSMLAQANQNSSAVLSLLQ
jgi:flagellin